MTAPRAAWDLLVAAFEPVFTRPSFSLFSQLVSAWVLCPGRHTVTRMIGMLDPHRRRPHDAYHRLLRAGAWSLQDLWRLLAEKLVASLVPQGGLLLDLDDTLFHKAGRKIEGAGVFRDAVRSTRACVVYALGLNLVVLTLRVRPPWKGEPLGLPLNLRLYRKGGPSHIDLAEEMIRQLAGWFPDRKLSLCCDGAFASLAGRSLPRTHVTSRMRRDAALFELPPPRKPRRRGRPRKRGRRLPTPEGIARRLEGWARKIVDFRGRLEKRRLLSRPVLWYKVCP
ncbi:MAG: IS701 family transposase, partial [Candidatus Methylomirabilales bacterium]